MNCSKCGEHNHGKRLRCKACNNPMMKIDRVAKHSRGKPCELKELKNGDLISVSGGPVWITQAGEEIGLGEYGKFKVNKVVDNGIYATELEDRVPTFIYTGHEYQSKSGTLMKPHKVLKYK